MPPKVIPITMTVNRLTDVQDTSMENASINNNMDSAWFKNTLQQLIKNQNALKIRIDAYNHQLVKMLLIKRFAKDKAKLKGIFM